MALRNLIKINENLLHYVVEVVLLYLYITTKHMNTVYAGDWIGVHYYNL